jgi:hypothetical protein
MVSLDHKKGRPKRRDNGPDTTKPLAEPLRVARLRKTGGYDMAKITMNNKEMTLEAVASELVRLRAETSDFRYFGLRVDSRLLDEGDELGNSHQWWQEWDDEECYNAKVGMYDGGELDGTCSIGIEDEWMDDVNEVLPALSAAPEHIKDYKSLGSHIYLIGGYSTEGGNDPHEWVISGAAVVGKVEL